jgi:hypothetical protein
MAVDIDSFKAGLGNHGGFARPNRYNIKITSMGSGGATADNAAVDFLASAVTIPSRTIATNEVAQHRETYKNPYTYIDGDVVVTFIIPNDFYPRTLIDTWMQKIISPVDYTLRYKNEYAGSIEISAVNPKDGKESYGVRLLNCFPVTMGEIQMANDNENSIMTMDVTFAYDYFQDLDQTGGQIGSKTSGLALRFNIPQLGGTVTIN